MVNKFSDIPKCSTEEMEDFPRRMREWLFNVMHDLAQRHELDTLYLELEQEAERDLSKKWSNAVIWKFCELDTHPYDRQVSVRGFIVKMILLIVI